jgi:hypothetical protein
MRRRFDFADARRVHELFLQSILRPRAHAPVDAEPLREKFSWQFLHAMSSGRRKTLWLPLKPESVSHCETPVTGLTFLDTTGRGFLIYEPDLSSKPGG